MKLILFWCFFDSRGCGGVKTGKLNPHSIQLAWSNMKTLEAHAPSKKEPTIFAHQDPLNLLPHPFEEMLRSKGMMRPLCSQKRTVQEHGGFQPSHKALHPRSLPEFKSARAPGSRASPKSPGQIFPRLGGPFLQSFNTKRVTLRIHPDMSSRNCMTCPPRTTGTSEKKKKKKKKKKKTLLVPFRVFDRFDRYDEDEDRDRTSRPRPRPRSDRNRPRLARAPWGPEARRWVRQRRSPGAATKVEWSGPAVVGRATAPVRRRFRAHWKRPWIILDLRDGVGTDAGTIWLLYSIPESMISIGNGFCSSSMTITPSRNFISGCRMEIPHEYSLGASSQVTPE